MGDLVFPFFFVWNGFRRGNFLGALLKPEGVIHE